MCPAARQRCWSGLALGGGGAVSSAYVKFRRECQGLRQVSHRMLVAVVTRGALQVASQIQLCNCQRTFQGFRLELHVASSHESPHLSKRSRNS